MAGAFVQSWDANGGTGVSSSQTVTVSGATANNMLFAKVVIRTSTNTVTVTTPTGWTLIDFGRSNDIWSGTYYRVASGTSADDFALSWSTTKRWDIGIAEYSGLATTSPIDVTVEHTADLTTVNVTSQQISATPTVDGFAVTTWGCDKTGGTSDVTLLTSIDSSYTMNLEAGSIVSNTAFLAIASKDLTSTATTSPTWTYDTSEAANDGIYVTLTVFKEAGGATGINADVDVTLGSLTLDGAASVALNAALSETLGALTLSAASASVDINGDVSATFADVTLDASATALSGIAADVDVTFADVGLSSAGVIAVDGDLAVTLDALTVDATATLVSAGISGTLLSTFDDATVDAAASVDIAGELGVTLGDVSLEGAATITAELINAVLEATLSDLTGEATGAVDIGGTLSTSLGEMLLTGTAVLEEGAVVDVTLDNLALDATGSLPSNTSLNVTFEDMTLESVILDKVIFARINDTFGS